MRKKNADLNRLLEIMVRGSGGQEEFQEPPHWQSRVMAHIRENAAAAQVFALPGAFALRLSVASLLLAGCLHVYTARGGGSADQDFYSMVVSSSSIDSLSADILWSER